jgi:hypothetical protein
LDLANRIWFPSVSLRQQVRLVLHTADFWLMLAVRNAIPKSRDPAKAEFATLRLKLKPRPPSLRPGHVRTRSFRISARRAHAARSQTTGPAPLLAKSYP